jgi:hypothetical protein
MKAIKNVEAAIKKLAPLLPEVTSGDPYDGAAVCRAMAELLMAKAVLTAETLFEAEAE